MRKLVFLCILSVSHLLVAQTLTIPTVPQELIYTHHNDDYTVCVRIPGGEWQDLYEYKVMVDLDNPQPASMVQFDFEGTVEVRIKVNNGMIHQVKIRPGINTITPAIQGNLIYFTLDKPSKLSVEINGDKLHNLHLFANAPETEIPGPDDENVIYFAPGLHRPKDQPGDAFNIPSHTTVYLAPGAVVKGKFICNRVENVRFIGRGIILEPQRGFEITFSKNIEINGITVINPTHYTVYGGESDVITIDNLKSFSCKGWSDGIDFMSCSDVTINDVFLRNSDDCIAIYTRRWNFRGDSRNWKVTNAILWADVAHPINIGLHGDSTNGGNVIENIHFRNIDILEHDEDDRNYQGCMAFSVSDSNLVQNVSFEDVRVDNIQEGQLFNLRVLYNPKYSYSSGRGIKNILFKNIYSEGSGMNPSVIEGYSDKENIEDVTFENIVINGKPIATFEEGDIKIGSFTKNIKLKTNN